MNDTQASEAGKPSIATRLFRWLFRWRTIRRALIALACFATLVALFYTEENWRGKWAWEKCKAELEANGAVLDWEKFIPPPVPDDQNFFKAPGIGETNWVGRGSRELDKRLSAVWQGNTNPMFVAELTVVSSRAAPEVGSGGTILRLDDSAAPLQAEQMVRTVIGPSLSGMHGFYPLLARPLNEIKPAESLLVADNMPTLKEIAAVFTATVEGSHLSIKPSGTNSFEVWLSPPAVAADDYLRLSDPFEADFDAVREALKRPYTRIDCDYSQPALISIPNFITLRNVAQVLAERTKCYLLLGQPDKALRDLTLLHDICRITEAKPTGKPMTLVASMINVAITEVYASTIADGMRLQAWREPQLVALQAQLAGVNLAPLVGESFREERVHATHTFEHMPRAEIVKLFDDETPSLRKQLQNPRSLFLLLAPRGWFYQNMISHVGMIQPTIETYDLTNGLILPDKTRIAQQQMANLKKSPYNFLTAMFLPNFARAWRTVAHNQTLANEALIACALERYRLTNGHYPETLDALAPQFIEKIPHDLIGGQPLHYRRTEDGNFLLYSVGWNEKDDGGTTVRNGDGKEDWENGDWVWPVN